MHVTSAFFHWDRSAGNPSVLKAKRNIEIGIEDCPLGCLMDGPLDPSIRLGGD